MFESHTDLHLPGPTIVPPAVRAAITSGLEADTLNYRSAAFTELLQRVQDKLRRVVGSDATPLILPGSGATGLEAGIRALLDRGDTAVVCTAGFFAEYAVSIVERIGAHVVRVDAEWGEAIDPAAVAASLRDHPEARAVICTHCETSTGVIHDVRAIAEVVAGSDAAFVVDAVSSLVSTELRPDAWGIDMVLSASQKALMLPPGLAIATVSEKGWRAIGERSADTFALDLVRYRETAERGATPFTPNVPLIHGLDAACDLILADGLEASWRRHALLRDMTRDGVRALGLRPFTDDAHASSTLTTVAIDDADAVRARLLHEHRFVVGGGLGRVSGRIVRLGHLGWTAPTGVLRMLAALETVLASEGHAVPLGAGVAAAQRRWLDAADTEPSRGP